MPSCCNVFASFLDLMHYKLSDKWKIEKFEGFFYTGAPNENIVQNH